MVGDGEGFQALGQIAAFAQNSDSILSGKRGEGGPSQLSPQYLES